MRRWELKEMRGWSTWMTQSEELKTITPIGGLASRWTKPPTHASRRLAKGSRSPVPNTVRDSRDTSASERSVPARCDAPLPVT